MRIFIDTSTYRMNNNGDKAMLHMAARRLHEQWPDAELHVMTSDPDGVKAVAPKVLPFVFEQRELWPAFGALAKVSTNAERAALLPVESALRRQYLPTLIEQMERRGLSRGSQQLRAFTEMVESADAVMTMGGGFFCDYFASAAAAKLDTLELGLDAGKPVFMMGGGFEPVEDPLLRAKAQIVLPRLTMIACREGSTAPQVLHGFGVEPGRVRVGCDDAVELAYEARAASLGSHLGVNLRIATYSETDTSLIRRLKPVLNGAARRYGATLVPLPISLYWPSDVEAMAPLFPDPDAGRSLDTPQALFAALHQCRVVVVGSYHAAVFALSQGIPTIALARSLHYRVKMQGLVNEFGGGMVLNLDDPNLTARLAEAIDTYWRNAEDGRPALLEAAQRQIEQNKAAYTEMAARVAAHQPAPLPPAIVLSPEVAEAFLTLGDVAHRLATENRRLQQWSGIRQTVTRSAAAAARRPLTFIRRTVRRLRTRQG